MRRFVFLLVLTGVVWSAGVWEQARGASPAAPTFLGVEQKIDSIRKAWAREGAPEEPNAPGWNVFFDALRKDLHEFATARTSTERLTPLNRVYQMSVALASVDWPPAAELREEVRQWLRPRVRLAWAERRLDETVRSLPSTTDSSVLANRKRWVDFVQSDLGHALNQYDQAATVAQRQSALNRIHEALGSLSKTNREHPWQPSTELQNAIDDLFNRPNLDITADVSTVAPFLERNLIETGPVFRKGYWSQVTAGAKTGFGLLPSDDGIAFYNSQLYSSSTPIHDFQNQIASDQRGQRAAKLYQFSATSVDWAELTITTVLSSAGLQISPSYKHSIDAMICSLPTPGGGMGRLVASLIGMNQGRITQKVYEGAIGNFRQRIPIEAQEEGEERTSAEAARRNAELQARYLIGNNTLAIRDFLITQLSLRSRPDAAYIGGLLQARDQNSPRGADAPQPARLANPDSGLTADLHLSSILTSLAHGMFQRDEIKNVKNLMVQTRNTQPGTPPKDAVTVTRNVDFAGYSSAAAEVRKAGNSKVTAIRIKRPSRAPEFATDARGYLVALIHDLEFDVPAPEAGGQAGVIGVPAKVLRIKIPELEIALSPKVKVLSSSSLQVAAKIEEFNPSTNSQVLAINDDESKAAPLTRFSGALVLAAMGGRLRTMPIDTTLENLDFPGFTIQSISPLDPSGWLRLNLAVVPERLPVPAN